MGLGFKTMINNLKKIIIKRNIYMKNIILSIIILLITFGLSAERITLNSAESRSVTWTVLECHDDFTTIEVSFNFYDSRNV